MTGLTFVETGHQYAINGRPVPSVTQVLGDVIPGWQAAEWYLQRGTVVHACAAMIARGQDFDHDPEIDGQVTACRRFFAEVRPVVRAVETRVGSPRYGYAGTMDMLMSIGAVVYVADWKAAAGYSARYQLAAYALAIPETTGRLAPRMGITIDLLETGQYRMSEPHDLRQLRAGWLALLGAYKIRREAGIKEDDDAGE